MPNPYEVLVERILLGEYSPGTSLGEQEIARDLGVSRTPVREALLRLKYEGLVRIIPRGGIFVEETTIQTIRDVTEVRLVLEECLVRLAVERCSVELVQEFSDWLDRTDQEWPGMTRREWLQRDYEFHQIMYDAADNGALAHHLKLLRRQAVLFWGQLGEKYNSLEAINLDFRTMLEGLEARDAEKCVAVIRRHVLADITRIQTFLNPQPPGMSESPLSKPNREE